MNKDIKAILKAAANKQEINDLTDKIIANVDTSKIEYSRESIKAPKRKFNFFPLMIAGIATAVLVITLSISIGIMNTNNSNTVNPNPTLPTEPVVEYEEITLNKLETFYAQFTVNDAPNMINIVNTFNNVSFIKPDSVATGQLKPDMEESIVNDVDLFLYNIEDMLGKIKTESKLVSSTDKNYIINVSNQNYTYKIFYNETLTEEKNVDKSNYKYKADLVGKVVIGNNEYSFTGEKRIKNSKLIYTTNITLATNKNVSVEEIFTINSDFTINYNLFEFRYLYSYGTNTKNVRMTQRFDADKNVKEIRFVANESEINEVKMTIKPQNDYYIKASIDSRNDDLYVTKNNDQYTYRFKNSNNEYTK